MEILIGLIEHLGDIVACEPVSRFLRLKYPHAKISWCAREPYRELIDRNPHLDATIVVDCLTDWIKLVKHSDTHSIIDLHVNHRACPQCQIPIIKTEGAPYITVMSCLKYGAILETFSLSAGLPALNVPPQIYLQDEDRRFAASLGLSHYCVIHGKSNAAAKDWKDSSWAELIRHLLGLGLNVVEVGAGAGIAVPPAPGFTSLLNQTSILQTAAVLEQARLFIGVDSGPAHLANALSLPGIVFLGAYESYARYNPFTGSYATSSNRVRLLQHDGPVADLPVQDVKAALESILAHPAVAAPATPSAAIDPQPFAPYLAHDISQTIRPVFVRAEDLQKLLNKKKPGALKCLLAQIEKSCLRPAVRKIKRSLT
jgi:ADP-heptose:LPS heptosyltransferase